DPARADALVAKRIDELGLPTYPVDAPDVHVAVHEDASGTPRIAFVMNPTQKTVLANVGVGRAKALVDLLPRARAATRIDAQPGGFVVEVASRTVRMFAIES